MYLHPQFGHLKSSGLFLTSPVVIHVRSSSIALFFSCSVRTILLSMIDRMLFWTEKGNDSWGKYMTVDDVRAATQRDFDKF